MDQYMKAYLVRYVEATTIRIKEIHVIARSEDHARDIVTYQLRLGSAL